MAASGSINRNNQTRGAALQRAACGTAYLRVTSATAFARRAASAPLASRYRALRWLARITHLAPSSTWHTSHNSARALALIFSSQRCAVHRARAALLMRSQHVCLRARARWLMRAWHHRERRQHRSSYFRV